MPSPKNPIRLLAESLSAQPSLIGFAKVLSGKNSLAATRSPPSIVIFAVEGPYQSPHNTIDSIIDVDLKIVASIWGNTDDEAWDLRQRYLQALKAQAIGNAPIPISAAPDQAGLFITFLSETWDVSPDTAQQGQQIEVAVIGRFSAAPTIQLGIGEVDSSSIAGAHTPLTSDLNIGDANINVVSTVGFGTVGEVSIDSEEIEYSSKTATYFVVSNRGTNGTTQSAHARGSVVNRLDAYADTVMTDGPILFYRLNDPTGSSGPIDGSLSHVVQGKWIHGDQVSLVSSILPCKGGGEGSQSADSSLAGFDSNLSGLAPAVTNFSIEWWIYPRAFALDANSVGPGAGLFYCEGLAGGDIKIGTNGDGTLMTLTAFYTVNQLHHVVYTYDGTTGSVYRNGALVHAQPQSIPALIGQPGAWGPAAGAGGWFASFANIALYNTVLSPSRIAYHYQVGITV